MATVTVTSGTLTVPLAKIHLPVNGRDRDLQHVAALAGSISRQGLLSPVTITPASPAAAAQGYDYDLVAAFHRYVAVCQFGHAAIDVVLPPPLLVECRRAGQPRTGAMLPAAVRSVRRVAFS